MAMTRTSTLSGVTAPDAVDLALLQHAEQLGLHGERDLRHLVEDQGAAGGHLEPPGPAPHRAGEGAALVAEQLGLHEGLGQRGAVDGDEGAALPRARVVDEASEHLLARARLALDEHGGLGPRHPAREGEQSPPCAGYR